MSSTFPLIVDVLEWRKSLTLSNHSIAEEEQIHRKKNMSLREDNVEGRDLKKPFLHTGSWYRMSGRQSSVFGSTQAIRDSSISVFACVLIVALGPIQFGFTVRISFSCKVNDKKHMGNLKKKNDFWSFYDRLVTPHLHNLLSSMI